MPECILVTGAAGYLGHKVAGYLNRHFPVIGVDVRQPEHPPCRMIETDVRDPALERVLRQEGVSHVIHLASVLESTGDPARDYDIDVNGTCNVVSACLATGVGHLTVTSSGAVYGYHADNPDWLDEQAPLRANRDFPYAWHKYLIEQHLAELRQRHPALRQLILRPGTVLGAETRNPITRLFEKNTVLGIRGSASPFVFLWDEDLVNIIARGVQNNATGIYNLAGDGALTLDEVAAILGKPVRRVPASMLRWALAVGHVLGLTSYRPAQVNFLRYRPVLDNRQLKTRFGYTPRLDSRETFELFVKYARQRGQL